MENLLNQQNYKRNLYKRSPRKKIWHTLFKCKKIAQYPDGAKFTPLSFTDVKKFEANLKAMAADALFPLYSSQLYFWLKIP